MKHYHLKTTITVVKGPALLAKSTQDEAKLKKCGVTSTQIEKLVRKGVLIEVDEPKETEQAADIPRTDGGNKEPQSYDPSELEELSVPVLQAKYKEEVAKYPNIAPSKMPKGKEMLIDFLSVNYTGD